MRPVYKLPEGRLSKKRAVFGTPRYSPLAVCGHKPPEYGFGTLGGGKPPNKSVALLIAQFWEPCWPLLNIALTTFWSGKSSAWTRPMLTPSEFKALGPMKELVPSLEIHVSLPHPNAVAGVAGFAMS